MSSEILKQTLLISGRLIGLHSLIIFLGVISFPFILNHYRKKMRKEVEPFLLVEYVILLFLALLIGIHFDFFYVKVVSAVFIIINSVYPANGIISVFSKKEDLKKRKRALGTAQLLIVLSVLWLSTALFKDYFGTKPQECLFALSSFIYFVIWLFNRKNLIRDIR